MYIVESILARTGPCTNKVAFINIFQIKHKYWTSCYLRKQMSSLNVIYLSSLKLNRIMHIWLRFLWGLFVSCTQSIKLLAIPLSTNNPECSRCGAIMVYRSVHALMEYSFLDVYRQSLWDDIVDLLDVSISVEVFQTDDITYVLYRSCTGDSGIYTQISKTAFTHRL